MKLINQPIKNGGLKLTSRVPISTRHGSGYGKSETSSQFNDFKKSGDIPTPKLQVCFLRKEWDGTKRNEPIPDKNTRRCNPQTYGILLGWRRMSEVHNPLQVAKGFGLIVSMDGCDAVSCGEKTFFLSLLCSKRWGLSGCLFC